MKNSLKSNIYHIFIVRNTCSRIRRRHEIAREKEEVGCRSGLHKDVTLWFIASVAGIADAATKHCFETNRNALPA
jgi:hypothetical protein